MRMLCDSDRYTRYSTTYIVVCEAKPSRKESMRAGGRYPDRRGNKSRRGRRANGASHERGCTERAGYREGKDAKPEHGGMCRRGQAAARTQTTSTVSSTSTYTFVGDAPTSSSSCSCSEICVLIVNLLLCSHPRQPAPCPRARGTHIRLALRAVGELDVDRLLLRRLRSAGCARTPGGAGHSPDAARVRRRRRRSPARSRTCPRSGRAASAS
jgi:hypothetical protein